MQCASSPVITLLWRFLISSPRLLSPLIILTLNQIIDTQSNHRSIPFSNFQFHLHPYANRHHPCNHIKQRWSNAMGNGLMEVVLVNMNNIDLGSIQWWWQCACACALFAHWTIFFWLCFVHHFTCFCVLSSLFFSYFLLPFALFVYSLLTLYLSLVLMHTVIPCCGWVCQWGEVLFVVMVSYHDTHHFLISHWTNTTIRCSLSYNSTFAPL